VARSTVGYVSRLVARDAPVVPALRTLAAQYPRYGYRTIRIFLERAGHVLGTDRIIACGARNASRCRRSAHAVA
jgi:putative transposase